MGLRPRVTGWTGKSRKEVLEMDWSEGSSKLHKPIIILLSHMYTMNNTLTVTYKCCFWSHILA